MSSAKQPRRFSHRVFKVFALSLLTVSALFTGYSYQATRQRLEGDLVDRARMLGALLASGAKTAVFSENAALVQDTLQGVIQHREVLSAAVFNLDRTLLTAKGRDQALRERAGKLTAAETEAFGKPEMLAGCTILQDQEHADVFCPILIRTGAGPAAELFFETPAVATGEEIAGFVKLSLDCGPLQRHLRALLLRSLLLALALLLAGTAAALFLARRVTEPLERLTDAVRAFGTGAKSDGSIREIPRTSDDEVGRLAEAFTTMIHDLSERDKEKERLAERLRESQKMEAVGTLSQGISHDFKNILSTLKGAVHILQKGSPDNEFVLKYTGKMQVSIDRARDLVERLVVFSRTRQLQEGPVDLTALLARLAPTLRDTVGEGVRLNVESPREPVLVRGDAASLEQMLTNLAYNARDALPEGGNLFMRLETVAGPTVPEPGTARITVRDNGVGMDAETRRRLFEPFFTTKDVGGGMGLGLSIVHGIVEQHHGRIEVESGLGEGTTFRVDLPMAVGADDELAPVSGAGGAAKG
ncbi:MAG: ATP-binding protein [Candidatus Methylomirabilia bacterium]